MIRLQQHDTDLSSFIDLVDKADHRYNLRSGVLIRRWKDRLSPEEAEIHQIVVPTVLLPKLSQLAHDIPAAGHLGIAKTKNRLLRHFHWSSISRDTKDFCRSCDVCQQLGKGKSMSPAPLHSYFSFRSRSVRWPSTSLVRCLCAKTTAIDSSSLCWIFVHTILNHPSLKSHCSECRTSPCNCV